MNVSCPSCKARYRIRKAIDARGARISCPSCAWSFLVYPDSATPSRAALSESSGEQSQVGLTELSQVTASWPLPPPPPAVPTIVPMERREDQEDPDDVTEPVPEADRRILARTLLAEERATAPPPAPPATGWFVPVVLVATVAVAGLVCAGIGAGFGLLGDAPVAVVAPVAEIAAPAPAPAPAAAVAPAPAAVAAPTPTPSPVAVEARISAPKPTARPKPATSQAKAPSPAPAAAPGPEMGVSTSDLVDPFAGN